MKQVLFFIAFTSIAYFTSYSQSKEETEIRKLEQLEITTVQKADTTALLNIWAKEFVVNNPYQQIVTVPQIFGFIRNGQIDYTTVERKVEKVTIVENIAISMGKEIVTPEKKTNYAGKIVTRQYTNIWIKRNNSWMMVGRQATIISAE
jgi:hypothetical protein